MKASQPLTIRRRRAGREEPQQTGGDGHPKLMESCITTDSRPLPLLANSGLRSCRVRVFMAENCSELMAPNTISQPSSTP